MKAHQRQGSSSSRTGFNHCCSHNKHYWTMVNIMLLSVRSRAMHSSPTPASQAAGSMLRNPSPDNQTAAKELKRALTQLKLEKSTVSTLQAKLEIAEADKEDIKDVKQAAERRIATIEKETEARIASIEESYGDGGLLAVYFLLVINLLPVIITFLIIPYLQLHKLVAR